MDEREYLTTHRHISFQVDLSAQSPVLWLMLGEAKSKAKHIGWSLLSPETSRELLQVYLTKGALATTAIEGNTLSEDEARNVVEGRARLPRSKEYLAREIENIVRAFNTVKDDLMADGNRQLEVSDLLAYNEIILDGLELEEGVVPGAIRDYSVGVGGVYRAAPARDCEYLLTRLCEWINGPTFKPRREMPEYAAPFAILQAIIAHLYLAWIHPFGDGNGRTARLLEHWILLKAGFPAPTTQLLSNHYNATRSEYYRQLQRAGKTGDISNFVLYATRGLVEGLQEQLDTIWRYEAAARWEQHIYQTFGHIRTASERRRLRLVLAMPVDRVVAKVELRHLTTELAELYAGKTTKTLTRDVNALLTTGLVRRVVGGIHTNDHVIMGFMPTRMDESVLDLPLSPESGSANPL
ncbi:MAG: Fic family protein [Gaiellaceae bacterium]